MSENYNSKNKNGLSLIKDINLPLIFSITLMAVLGLTTISPAFPKMVEKLNVPTKDIGLLLTVFTLPGIFLTPVLGILADRYGRRTILLPSLVLYGLAGFACVFIRQFDLLLIMRFIEGIGAAALGSLNVTLIGDLYSGNKRTAIMGYNMSILSIGTASFPLIGGALAMIAWYYPFILPILNIPVAILVYIYLKDVKLSTPQSFKLYFKNAVKSFKSRHILGLLFSSVMTYIILFGAFLTYIPFLIKNIYGSNPFIIGILLSSMSFTAAIVASQLGKVVKYINEKNLVKYSFLVYCSALLIMAFVQNIWLLFIPTILFGIAQGVNVPSVHTLLSQLTLDENRAAFMSINRTVSQIGQTTGPLLMSIIFNLWGISSVFFAGTIIALIVFIFVFWMIE
jgi:MFS transporter, ACDE family, multidrug resistance protein